ncbi:MAG: hypothetical protein EA379_09895 [Phycisphaerales bacterium]|nr:MAG: hypothetical protein EA379_09895 [Phycisphaerales bacterium]
MRSATHTCSPARAGDSSTNSPSKRRKRSRRGFSLRMRSNISRALSRRRGRSILTPRCWLTEKLEHNAL